MTRRRRAGVGMTVAGLVLLATLGATLGGACRAVPERDSCGQVIGGTWRVQAPAERAGHAWAIDDRGARLELFALSPPGAPATELGDGDAAVPGQFAAPTAISLERSAADGGTELTGTARRRFTRGATSCVVKVPARVEGCRGDTLTLHLPTITPPADLAACPTDPDQGAAPVTYTLRQTAHAR